MHDPKIMNTVNIKQKSVCTIGRFITIKISNKLHTHLNIKIEDY